MPYTHRDTEPRFDHYPDLPRWQEQGVDLTLLTGTLNGREAPTLAFSPLVGADMLAHTDASVRFDLRSDFEYGVLVLEGTLRIGRDTFEQNELAYLGCGLYDVALDLDAGSRVLLLGGEPLGEDILIWWNFVGHSKAEIAQAQHDWEAGDARFGDVPDFDGERLVPPPIPWRVEPNT